MRKQNRRKGRWRGEGSIIWWDLRNRRSISMIAADRVTGAPVFVSDKSSRASTVLAQCRTNLPSRTHDITTPAWRLVIYHPAANLHYVWRTVETVENTVHLALSDSYVQPCLESVRKAGDESIFKFLFTDTESIRSSPISLI